MTDTLVNENGVAVMLDEPNGMELPPSGFAVEDAGFIAPADDGSPRGNRAPFRPLSAGPGTARYGRPAAKNTIKIALKALAQSANSY